jgi:serine-type D-Ala-D-Ala carboxypeptidase (penicillin-binding protein 5/6)
LLRIRFRFTYILFCLLIGLITAPMYISLAAPPSISADAAIVMDVTTGEVLFEKNARKLRAPASTTKILTAIVALEKGNLQDMVTVSRHAAYTKGSSVHLSPDEKLLLDDLLVGLMLRSGNDSAVAIAEHIAETEHKFAELSTARAKELGAKNTTFRNPHGLSVPGHLTTAYDLAILTRYALINLPRFAEIVSTREDTIDWDGRSYDRQLRNTNKLLWMFEGADGVKTGTTKEAGQCLVSSATRDGQQLIAVVLHSGNRWNDSVRLLQYGFDNFTLLHFAEKDAVHQSIPVIKGMQECIDAVIADYVDVIVPKSHIASVRLEYDVPQNVEAPVYRGQKIGEITVYNGNQVIKVVDLVAGQEVLNRTPVRVILNYLLAVYHKMAGWGWF